MYDINLVYWCRSCECISYVCPECCKNLCGGNFCDLCEVLYIGVWAWIDSQNIDEDHLRKTGEIQEEQSQ